MCSVFSYLNKEYRPVVLSQPISDFRFSLVSRYRIGAKFNDAHSNSRPKTEIGSFTNYRGNYVINWINHEAAPEIAFSMTVIGNALPRAGYTVEVSSFINTFGRLLLLDSLKIVHVCWLLCEIKRNVGPWRFLYANSWINFFSKFFEAGWKATMT